jgi:hypothetical protein
MEDDGYASRKGQWGGLISDLKNVPNIRSIFAYLPFIIKLKRNWRFFNPIAKQKNSWLSE